MGRKKHFFLWKTKKGNKGKTYEMVYAFKNWNLMKVRTAKKNIYKAITLQFSYFPLLWTTVGKKGKKNSKNVLIAQH